MATIDDDITNLQKECNNYLNSRAEKTFIEANKHCKKLVDKVTKISNEFLLQNNLPVQSICFIAIGSVGRNEALAASDLDLIPVTQNTATLELYKNHDKDLRQTIKNKLNIKVSLGSDLTKCTCIDNITNLETIGGPKDDSATLTQRMLILSESVCVGGELEIENIREQILLAYSESQFTRGRHVLSLCNDMARYYRTLCIEYKAKVDVEDKDWCTRNLKLRHSRKMWYFSSIIAIASLAHRHPAGEERYTQGLLHVFNLPPALRFFGSLNTESQKAFAGRVLNRFAWFLSFMADNECRTALSNIEHNERYKIDLSNPFPMMKLNSDTMHLEIFRIIDDLDGFVRQRIYDWFLL